MAPKTPFIDHYAVLEIQFGASAVEIRRAWIRLVKQWQSKADSGDIVATERLQQIHEAYGVLSDPSQCAEYDREYEQHRRQLEHEKQRTAPKTPFIDHYAALEIQFGASAAEIRRTWMHLVKQWQSKANNGDPVADVHLQQIHEAYTVLSDPSQHAEYNREYEAQYEAQYEAYQLEEGRRQREAERGKFEEQELLKWLKLEEESRKLKQEQSEKEQEEAERERREHLKQIIIYLTIVVLIIAGVVGVGALIWFV